LIAYQRSLPLIVPVILPPTKLHLTTVQVGGKYRPSLKKVQFSLNSYSFWIASQLCFIFTLMTVLLHPIGEPVKYICVQSTEIFPTADKD